MAFVRSIVGPRSKYIKELPYTYEGSEAWIREIRQDGGFRDRLEEVIGS